MFSHLGISVRPKRGAALIWANTHNDNVSEVDARAEHEARPVIAGRSKLVANLWIRQHDYRGPWASKCTDVETETNPA